MDTDHRKLYRVRLEYQAFVLAEKDEEAAEVAEANVIGLDPLSARTSVVQRVQLTEVELEDPVWMAVPVTLGEEDVEEDDTVTVRQCLDKMAKEGRR